MSGVIRHQQVFIGLALLYIGAGGAAALAGLPMEFSLYKSWMLLGVFGLALAFPFWRLFRLILSGERGRPTVLFLRDLRQFLTVERLLWPVPALLLLPSVLSLYTSWKVLIPTFTAMDWDKRLADIDAMIHGGDVWALLHPLLGFTLFSQAAFVIYAGWLPMFYAVLVWQIFTKGEAREQYLVTFVICWGLLGTIGAAAFASVGPTFYERLLGDDRFAGLNAYLRTTPEWVYYAQEVLWSAYERGEMAAFGKGISAMPSLHVAVATLNALVAARSSKWLGRIFAAYAVLVAVASVHLGWHYAIDAYAGAAAALVIWHGVGLALRRIPKPVSVPAE